MGIELFENMYDIFQVGKCIVGLDILIAKHKPENYFKFFPDE